MRDLAHNYLARGRERHNKSLQLENKIPTDRARVNCAHRSEAR
jgi:hypothetical protein